MARIVNNLLVQADCFTYLKHHAIISGMARRLTGSEWQQVKVAYAGGTGLREMARSLGVPEGTVLAKANRDGWTQEIETAKQQLQSPRPECVQSGAITQSVAQSVALSMEQRGKRHAERMAGIAEKVVPHVEGMHPGEILESIHEVEKFDKMARRTYGLDEAKMNEGMVSMTFIRMHIPDAIEKPADAVEI